MNIGQRLKNIRESKGISRRELAKKMGKDSISFEQYLYKLESGKISSPGIELIEAISKALGISSNYLIEEEKNDLETLCAIRVLDVCVGAGNPAYSEEYIYVDSMVFTQHVNAIKVKGDSMEPLIKEGEYLIVDTEIKDIVNGKVYVIADKDGGLLIRRVYKLENGLLRLLPENKLYKKQDVNISDIRIIGRAIRVVSPSKKI